MIDGNGPTSRVCAACLFDTSFVRADFCVVDVVYLEKLKIKMDKYFESALRTLEYVRNGIRLHQTDAACGRR